ncbi:hypothetical protein ACF0H5_009501 [Mactra antiquata]
MAAKSQSKLADRKSSKSGGSGSNLSAKSDAKNSKKRVTMEDDDGDEKESLAFKILTVEQTNDLMPCDVNQIQEKLMTIFNLENYTIDLPNASILDYYTSAVYWAIQQKFTPQQLSGFFTVVHTLLENIKDKHMSMVENTIEFHKLFAGVGMDDVKAGSLDFFSTQEAKTVTQYIYSTLFQHYKLFLFMFTHSQAEEIIGTDLDVEVAKAANVPFPPPLEEGVSEDMFKDFIATPPPSPSPEHKSRDTKSAKAEKPSGKASATPRSRGATPRSRGGTPKGTKTSKSRGGSRGSSRGPASAKKVMPEEEKPDPTKELEDKVSQSDLFSELTPEDVRDVIESVAKEMLGGLQSDVAVKLRDKESQILQRINKIHKIAD